MLSGVVENNSFQQGGTPVQYFTQAKQLLSTSLAGSWIGAGYPISTPPGSLSRTPFSFFM